MKFLFIEPFYGGSHRVFCDGLIANSKHEIDLVTLPDENFRWRIRGSAYYFLKNLENIEKYDGIIISDMISLSDFKGLFKKDLPPVLLYFHENQIDYPLADNQKIDYHLVFSNINSALCADMVCFNSNTHLKSFISSCETIIKRMPDDHDDSWIIDEIKGKSFFIYPGCSFKGFSDFALPRKNKIPKIVWNHRWDHDKKPEIFFRMLRHLKKDGHDFRLFILGEKGPKKNIVFMDAKDEFAREIEFFGYAENREDYIKFLEKSDIVVSTAVQENFGYSIVEAVKAGCVPLLPDRLSYPEIIPHEFHELVLYKNYRDLLGKAGAYLSNPELLSNGFFKELFIKMENYSWEKRTGEYDDILEKLSKLA